MSDKPKNPAAVALGKLKSPRKAESSRQNGKLGGKPRRDWCAIVRHHHLTEEEARICMSTRRLKAENKA